MIPLGLYKPRQPLNIFKIDSDTCRVIKPNESCNGAGEIEKPFKQINDARGAVEYEVNLKLCLSETTPKSSPPQIPMKPVPQRKPVNQ